MKSLSALGPISLLTLAPALLGATPSASWTVFETARDNGHRLAAVPLDAPSAPAEAAPLSVDTSRRHQEMIGFGGALTEASAWALAQLPAKARLEVLKRYYDPKDGIGYTLARTHLNSCDFSLSMWALDEVPGDYDLHGMTLAPMRRWVMPLLQDARKVAGGDARFRLLVSPWSPPAWMKTNNRMDDGGTLRQEYAPVWANYFVKFADMMQREEKFPIWGFTVQNEPEAHQTWESCLFTPEQERDFVKRHLGPALERAGLLGRVKLIGWDHNRDRIEARAEALLGDAESARYFWGLGVHWYVSNDFAASSRVNAKYPDKPVIFTEGCFEGGSNIGSWEHGEGYAAQMLGDFRHGVAAFIDWNIVLDERGGPNHVGNFCDAPVIVDTKAHRATFGPSFYYIGHFSRYVQPGAHRVESTGGPAGLEAMAFANPDGSLVVVAMNATGAALGFPIAAGGDPLTAMVPAHAIRTYVRAAK